jgi:hypothetical protein
MMKQLLLAVLLLIPDVSEAADIFGPIQSIQRGSITISNTNTSNTATISSVDLTRTLLEFKGWKADGSSATSNFCKIVLTNATTVTATRVGTSNDCIVEYEVIQYVYPFKSIQAGTIAMTNNNTTGTAALSAVATGKSVIKYLGASTDNATYANCLSSISITSTILVTASRLGNSDNCTVSYMVGETY